MLRTHRGNVTTYWSEIVRAGKRVTKTRSVARDSTCYEYWGYPAAGAAKHGGRFNRPGVHALYLSLEPDTAIAEYQQDLTLMPPGTLVAYEVALERVVGLSKGYQLGEWETFWEDWACDFRKLVLENTEPPSWLMGDLALEQSASGLLFRRCEEKTD